MFYIVICFYFFFFFSSRRRHTRSLRDWSSDVCSSDLIAPLAVWDRMHGDPGGTGSFVRYWQRHGLSSTVITPRSEEHTSELQSRRDLVCRLLLEKKKTKKKQLINTITL